MTSVIAVQVTKSRWILFALFLMFAILFFSFFLITFGNFDFGIHF